MSKPVLTGTTRSIAVRLATLPGIIVVPRCNRMEEPSKKKAKLDESSDRGGKRFRSPRKQEAMDEASYQPILRRPLDGLL